MLEEMQGCRREEEYAARVVECGGMISRKRRMKRKEEKIC